MFRILPEEIKTNMIFVGKHGWMANAMEDGTDWNINAKYRVSGVTNKFVMLVDKRGREETHKIDSKAAWQRFKDNYAYLRPMKPEDCYYNEKAGVYNITLDGWVSRKSIRMGVYGYQVVFDYKGYNFNLVWISDAHKAKVPSYMREIKKESMGEKFPGTWYLYCRSTYINKLEPDSFNKKIQDRVSKFMLFLFHHFDRKYALKIREFQMKQPLILLH